MSIRPWILWQALLFLLGACASTPEAPISKPPVVDDPSFLDLLFKSKKLTDAQSSLDAEVAAAKARLADALNQAKAQREEIERLLKEVNREASLAATEKGIDPAKLQELNKLRSEAAQSTAELAKMELELRTAQDKLRDLRATTPAQLEEAKRQVQAKQAEVAQAAQGNARIKLALESHLRSQSEERRRKEMLR